MRSFYKRTKGFSRKALKFNQCYFVFVKASESFPSIENFPSALAALSTTEGPLITKEVDSRWMPTEGSLSYTHTYTHIYASRFLFLSTFSLYIHSVFSAQVPVPGYNFICLTSVTGGTLEAILRLQ